MANGGTLHDAFVEELRDTYDAEKQITKVLPKMVKAATSGDLRSAFQSHLEETRRQIGRLEKVFGTLDERVRGKHCEGMAGILEEGSAAMKDGADESTLDAKLIAAAQRVEHYEMAAYGTLVSWARAMGHSEAANLLEESLEEEKAADRKLSSVAESGINQEAANGAHGDDMDNEKRPTRSRATRSKSGSRSAAKKSVRRY